MYPTILFLEPLDLILQGILLESMGCYVQLAVRVYLRWSGSGQETMWFQQSTVLTCTYQLWIFIKLLFFSLFKLFTNGGTRKRGQTAPGDWPFFGQNLQFYDTFLAKWTQWWFIASCLFFMVVPYRYILSKYFFLPYTAVWNRVSVFALVSLTCAHLSFN